MSELIEEKVVADESVTLDEESSKINAYKTEFNQLNKRIKKLEIISIISLLLLIVLIGTSFMNEPNPSTSPDNTQVTSQKDLPSNLSESEIESIGKQVVEAYNSTDIDTLYSVLGPYAQTVVTVEELEETMKGLSVLGSIGKYSYTHHEFIGNNDGADWYRLNYIANYSAGNGSLKINLRVSDNGWEIIGFFMNVEQLDLEKLGK